MAAVDIPVVPPAAFTLRFLYAVAIGFAAFVIYLYLRSTVGMSPEQAQAQLTGMLAMFGFEAVSVGLVIWAIHRRSITLDETALTIKAGFYTRRVSRSALQVDAGRTVSLFEAHELAPRWRTNGLRVPGFRAGWFRLTKRERSFVLLTDPRVVTYLPTTEGFSLLVSAPALLDALARTTISRDAARLAGATI